MVWAPDYVTAAELKGFVRISDAVDDTYIALAITAASRAVDRHTNRQFGLVASAEDRYYTAEWDKELRRWYLDIDDLMTITGLVVNADLNDDGIYSDVLDDLALRPVNSATNSVPWTRIYVLPDSTNQPRSNDAGVEVTARYGWTIVPDTIKKATLLQASRFFTRRNAPFGVAGSPDLGSEIRLLARLDPDVAVALGPYIRWWAAA